MAPERFRGQADGRSDVYGLGVTLYELLTLRSAFAPAPYGTLAEQVASVEPPRPRQIDRRIPRDLETVVLKAMAKEAGRRYASAGELAEDLRRFLEDRPVRARRMPWRERAWRWCRRNRAAVLTAVLVLFVLLAGIAGTTFGLIRAEEMGAEEARQRQLAEAAKKKATRQLYRALVDQARANRLSRRVGQRFETLRILKEAVQMARQLDLPREAFRELRNEAIAALALPDVRLAKEWEEPLRQLHFDGALEHYARADVEGNVSLRRVQDGKELYRFPNPNG